MTGDDTSWRERGTCTQVDPEIFFSADPETQQAAKTLCEQCEVLHHCTPYSLANVTGFGIQAAMTAEERKNHPDGVRALPLSAFLPLTEEQRAANWAAAESRRVRRTAAEAARRQKLHLEKPAFDDLIHPFDRKAGL